jgi:predicted acylesterase/phospholipase RssA
MKKVVCFHGGAKYFFWNIGVIQYLVEHEIFLPCQDLFVGMSAGALCAVLTICQIPSEKILSSVETICQKYNVFHRPWGLFGIWSSMIEEWLNDLLPEDAHERCNHKVHIILSCVSLSQPKYTVSSFENRDDLIQCLLATIHIPFFMDYFPVRSYRGHWCWDCAILSSNGDYEIFGKENEYSYHHLDYLQDKNLHSSYLFALQTSPLQELENLKTCGYMYAKQKYFHLIK